MFKSEEVGRGRVQGGDTDCNHAPLQAQFIAQSIGQSFQVAYMEFLKAEYSEGRSDTELLTELAEVPVLAIDELGKGRLSDWELTIIDEVVSRRYNAMGCTLATTNYRPGEPSGAAPPNLATTAQLTQTLGDRVGDRVFSRLTQVVDFIELAGRDHRTEA